jgi:glucose/mannose-6-phosphate isomerase
MIPDLAENRLDTPGGLAAADPGKMLLAVASAPAQVREAATLAGEAGLDRLAAAGRPRAIVVAGMGGSGVAGDVLAAVAGPGCPIPILTHRGYGLPGWVGAADLVIAVSCSGRTEETVSATEEAIRRGCQLMAVGDADSTLAEQATQAGAPFVPVPGGRQPRASLWALSLPLVMAGHQLGVLAAGPEVVEATARRLEQAAVSCRPDSESFLNPAKTLAVELTGALPMIWGSSPLAGVAAYRFLCQLAENAKYPAEFGVLPEANHNQVVTFDGSYGAGHSGGSGPDADFFADRAEESASPTRLQLVLLRDGAGAEHSQVARRAAVSRELAAERGIGVSEIVASGSSPLERLASLIAVPDFASVYLAIALGIDPTPVAAIEDLKVRIAT